MGEMLGDKLKKELSEAVLNKCETGRIKMMEAKTGWWVKIFREKSGLKNSFSEFQRSSQAPRCSDAQAEKLTSLQVNELASW